MYYNGLYFDWTYILVIIGAIITAIASWNVNHTFNKFSQTMTLSGITADECARRILLGAGITDVKIEQVSGNLTDHYDPKAKVLRLSQSVSGQSSIAAVGVAAHECGHAIQHKTGYFPLKLRSLSVPLANIGSWVSWPLIIIGLILGFTPLAKAGVYFFAFVVLFQLITLPVEINASRRALDILETQNILTGTEMPKAKKVLRAAAYTYVAALLSAILQLLRLFLITRNRRN